MSRPLLYNRPFLHCMDKKVTTWIYLSKQIIASRCVGQSMTLSVTYTGVVILEYPLRHQGRKNMYEFFIYSSYDRSGRALLMHIVII